MYRVGQEEVDEVAKVLKSRQWFRVGDPKWGHLQEAVRFEKEWAEKTGTKYALLMNGGGTAAIVCGLAGLGIGPGDEVLVPAYTWMATATAVLTVGAIPVLVEVDETMAMDPIDLEEKIGPKTRAVIPVHMLGRPAHMKKIMAVARKRGLKVLEDSCQMDGGSFQGRRTGSWGDAGAFSLNFFKIISSGGEGGVLVTNDRKVYECAVAYHDSGTAFRPHAKEISIPIFVAQQYRADEVMGAIARIQLKRLEGILADLRRICRRIEKECGLNIAPNNDFKGDCGVAAAFRFRDETEARSFLEKVKGEPAYLGINHDKHVYTNWTPLREKRIMHHPAMNPFNFPENRGLRAQYDESVCPRTLALLRRTVFFTINPEWTKKQVADKIKLLRYGGRDLVE